MYVTVTTDHCTFLTGRALLPAGHLGSGAVRQEARPRPRQGGVRALQGRPLLRHLLPQQAQARRQGRNSVGQIQNLQESMSPTQFVRRLPHGRTSYRMTTLDGNNLQLTWIWNVLSTL